MFVRADQLWLEEIEDRLPLHAIEFCWNGFSPVLTCHEASSGERIDIKFGSVDLVIGRGRVCVGRYEGEDYLECPDKARVSGFTQCEKCCKESFIPVQECVFDPRCEGDSEECKHEFCRRPHVLYLAFYSSMAKIGMSSSARVERRLIEQGADAFSIIGSFPNRFRARETEKEISRDLDLPQGIRQQTILRNFAKSVEPEGIRERFDELRAKLTASYGLEPRPLRTLTGYPLELPLSSAPCLQETPGRHKGALLGLKGKWLVYESEGIKALSMPDVVSRYLASYP